MAQPTKLTPQVTGQLVQLLRAGVSVDVATSVVGISARSFYAWMERGERRGRADAPYREFREAIERARGEHEAVLLARLNHAAAKGSWRAAAWLLERAFPERWGPPEQRAQQPTPAVPDELAALRERARRAQESDPT